MHVTQETLTQTHLPAPLFTAPLSPPGDHYYFEAKTNDTAAEALLNPTTPTATLVSTPSSARKLGAFIPSYKKTKSMNAGHATAAATAATHPTKSNGMGSVRSFTALADIDEFTGCPAPLGSAFPPGFAPEPSSPQPPRAPRVSADGHLHGRKLAQIKVRAEGPALRLPASTPRVSDSYPDGFNSAPAAGAQHFAAQHWPAAPAPAPAPAPAASTHNSMQGFSWGLGPGLSVPSQGDGAHRGSMDGGCLSPLAPPPSGLNLLAHLAANPLLLPAQAHEIHPFPGVQGTPRRMAPPSPSPSPGQDVTAASQILQRANELLIQAELISVYTASYNTQMNAMAGGGGGSEFGAFQQTPRPQVRRESP